MTVTATSTKAQILRLRDHNSCSASWFNLPFCRGLAPLSFHVPCCFFVRTLKLPSPFLDSFAFSGDLFGGFVMMTGVCLGTTTRLPTTCVLFSRLGREWGGFAFWFWFWWWGGGWCLGSGGFLSVGLLIRLVGGWAGGRNGC
jgi:hypothetical protein